MHKSTRRVSNGDDFMETRRLLKIREVWKGRLSSAAGRREGSRHCAAAALVPPMAGEIPRAPFLLCIPQKYQPRLRGPPGCREPPGAASFTRGSGMCSGLRSRVRLPMDPLRGPASHPLALPRRFPCPDETQAAAQVLPPKLYHGRFKLIQNKHRNLPGGAPKGESGERWKKVEFKTTQFGPSHRLLLARLLSRSFCRRPRGETARLRSSRGRQMGHQIRDTCSDAAEVACLR